MMLQEAFPAHLVKVLTRGPVLNVCKLATYFSGKRNGDVFCVIHLGILACTFISPRPKQMGTVYLFIQIGKCSSAKLRFGLILRHRFKAIKDAFQLV